MRRAARTDANHAAIVAAFRRLGYSVLDLSRVGQGCPDLLVARGGVSILVEVKDGAKTPSRRALRRSQIDFVGRWKGRTVVVECVDDVVRLKPHAAA